MFYLFYSIRSLPLFADFLWLSHIPKSQPYWRSLFALTHDLSKLLWKGAYQGPAGAGPAPRRGESALQSGTPGRRTLGEGPGCERPGTYGAGHGAAHGTGRVYEHVGESISGVSCDG